MPGNPLPEVLHLPRPLKLATTTALAPPTSPVGVDLTRFSEVDMSRKKKRRRTTDEELEEADSRALPARPSEQLLIDYLDEIACRGQMACTSIGRGQLAAALQQRSDTPVSCLILDLYTATQAREAVAEGAGQGVPEIICEPDLPAGAFDLIALPTRAKGETELTRELLQSACERLQGGGRLLASTDNPKDQWLHREIKKLCPKVTRVPADQGVVYSAVVREPPKKLKSFEASFTLKAADRVLTLFSRPGVFGHRRIDDGARAILKTLKVENGSRILDIGCGNGCLALASACMADDVTVDAMDSYSRAVECTNRAAAENDLSKRVTAHLNADGEQFCTGEYDIVLANPPYYSNYQIASIFVDTAAEALKSGGQLLLVTRKPTWFLENLPSEFGDLEDLSVGHYHIIDARRY